MKQALVSVVIPAYNAAAHLSAAVESALGQTYPELEVLVVDDGSKDQTAAIVEALAARDGRVRLLRQRNQGVATARNLGIEHARGEFIAPLDADDLWYPGKIEAQVRRMHQGGPTMGLVHTWWHAVDEEGRVQGASSEWTEEGWLFEALLFTNFIGNASIPLMRRSCLEHVGGYDPTLHHRGGQGCEDWDLSLRIAAAYEIGVVPEYLAAYRKVETGSMSSAIGPMARSYELTMEQVRQDHPEVPAALLRWSRANFYLYSAGVCHSTGQYAAVPRALATAVRADPAAALLPWVPKVLAKSLLRLVAGPLMKRLWPTPADWRAFRERRLPPHRPPVGPLGAPPPWWPRGYYNRKRHARWLLLTDPASQFPRPSPTKPVKDIVAGDGDAGSLPPSAFVRAPRSGE